MDPRASVDSDLAKSLSASPSKKLKQTQAIESDTAEGSDSEFPAQDVDDNDADFIDEDDAIDDVYHASSVYDDENVSDNDRYVLMQSQFDNVDLPPGVEASFSLFTDSSETKKESATSSDSTASAEKKSISRFDTVDSFTDHHYGTLGFKDTQPPKNWAKKIQEEWKILRDDLPETIYVRACESRMELLRSVIVGPQGTPYHDGLFVFDCLFPDNYPDSPPLVYYYSGGLRLNPNLYECGKVCLSLLGTWEGDQNENWIPGKSTMLQVLVSIQALILNDTPFFNEPGEDINGFEAWNKSSKYNMDVFLLSLKTMIYTLRRPPEHFEDLIAQHFRDRAHPILKACRAYTRGAEIGGDVVGYNPYENGERLSSSGAFKSGLASMMKLLVACFSKNDLLKQRRVST